MAISEPAYFYLQIPNCRSNMMIGNTWMLIIEISFIVENTTLFYIESLFIMKYRINHILGYKKTHEIDYIFWNKKIFKMLCKSKSFIFAKTQDRKCLTTICLLHFSVRHLFTLVLFEGKNDIKLKTTKEMWGQCLLQNVTIFQWLSNRDNNLRVPCFFLD